MKKKIVLFYPHVPAAARDAARKVLDTRWIGQGPKVDEFERLWEEKISNPHKAIAVGSGTDALHLAYILAGIKEGDEVVTPVFTCLYGETPVLLANGKTMKIKDIVNNKYGGKVASYNHKKKRIEMKKVINWYKSPRSNRKLVKLSYKNAPNSHSKYGGKKSIWVTEDHLIATPKGYIEAGKLKNGDLVLTGEKKLNKKQQQLLIGMLLGDGFLQKSSRHKENEEIERNARLYFAHTNSQMEWIKIKAEALKEFNPNFEPRRANKKTGSKPSTHVRFSYSFQWKMLLKRFYSGGKKIIPKDLSYKEFSNITLATWFMDDGALHGGKSYRGKGTLWLCTDGFSYEEVKKLVDILAKVGYKAKPIHIKKGQHRIYIGNSDRSATKFFKNIAPYVPPALRYKLPKDIANKYLFDPKRWNLGGAEYLCDEIIVENGKTPPGITSSHFSSVYCIDVKDNHNFISNNLILHNCSATTTPLLYQRAKPIFADIQKHTLNIDPKSVKELVNERTKAIICVHYGGLPADLDELQKIADKWNIPLIEDAAQAQGATYKGKKIGSISDFSCFSFQAIKLITTADGGMLTIKDSKLEDKAKRIRWFGIDRKAKMEDRWKNDIWEIGYKYQMTDVAAAMGIEALKIYDKTLAHHRKLFETYREELEDVPGITFIGEDKHRRSACWLATVFAENRKRLRKILAEHNIESNPVHYRNDMYSVFGGRVKHCPNMDALEDKYLVLPMHFHLSVEDIKYICEVIKKNY